MGEEVTACEMVGGACDRCGRCMANRTPEAASIVRPDQVESVYLSAELRDATRDARD